MIATVGAILSLFATGGFWPVGHVHWFGYGNLAACERGRPGVEEGARAHGYEGVWSLCREVVGRAS